MQDDQPAANIDQKASPEKTLSKTPWQFHKDIPEAANTARATGEEIKPIQWTASEFIAHTKDASWYLLLVIATLILAGGVYLLTGDKISTGMVLFVSFVFGVLAARKPRELPYGVDSKGINIGQKFYPYSTFRSFAIVQEGAIESIWLMPLKRFMPITSIYFEPTDATAITDVLSEYLPLENHQLDPVDKLMHRLRF